MDPISLDGNSLTLEEIALVSRQGAQVEISPFQVPKIRRARQIVEKRLKEKDPVYGITTGVGKLAAARISPEDSSELQRNIVLSHATGVGARLPEDVTRAIILLRINTLAKAYSGVRLELIEFLADLLNRRIHPLIFELGSVGASGDLAPLAHLALPVIGEGEVEYHGSVRKTSELFEELGLASMKLAPKEGLSLVNGTQATLGILVLLLLDTLHLSDVADIAGAMSVDALRGSPTSFDERIHSTRPHPGQLEVARRLSHLLDGSQIRDSHLECERIQDAYSVRCIPQVHGACRDLVNYAKSVIEREINSATDNPLVFREDDEILSGGNFHGEPLAFAGDVLAMALSEFASISERRIARFLDAPLSGLPPFLTHKSGLHSGMMIAHLTGAAAVAENKILSHPASVDSLPTSAGQEDHVSMSFGAALKAWRVRERAAIVLSIELLCGAQALDLLRPLRSSAFLERIHAQIREVVPVLDADRPLYKDILSVKQLLETDDFVQLG